MSEIGREFLGRRGALLVASLLAVAVVGIPQALASTTTVLIHTSQVTLPADAAIGNLDNFQSVSCASVGSCVTVGSYKATNGSIQAMVGPITNAVPGHATKVRLPSGYNSGTSQNANLQSVSCASSSSCVATGRYVDSSGAHQAMVVDISGGAPGTAKKVALPSDASSGGQTAYLESVSCASTSSCLASGFYLDVHGATQAMVVKISGGTPVRAKKVTLPSGAVSGASQYATLGSVSCASSSSCVAVGRYVDSSGAHQAMAVNIGSGTPGTAKKITLPAGYNNTSNQNAKLASVSCAPAGSCVAAGSYSATNAGTQAMVVKISSGTPSSAQRVVLPTGATSGYSQSTSLPSVSCASSSSCLAAGQYSSTSAGYEAMVVKIANGVANTAQKVVLPTGATSGGSQDAVAQSVSCAAAGSCFAVGYYNDATAGTEAMLARVTGGVAGTAQEVKLPAGAAGSKQLAYLSSVSCASTSSCAASGVYDDVLSGFETMITGIQPPLALTSTSLPKARVGIRYHRSLAAIGGIGGYGWSVSSGKLPRGLTLHASTGVISGVPKAGGKFSITFKVATSGPPAQSASAVLSLKVVKPHLRIPKGALRLHRKRAIVPLHCARARCVGTIKLKYRTGGRTITIGHHRFKIGRGHTAKRRVRLDATALNAIHSAGDHRIRVLERVTVKHGPNRKAHRTIR